MTEAYRGGITAFYAGASWIDNPYNITEDNENWEAWLDGYEAAEFGLA